ncbi:MAG: uroporphyrinogen-III C-methyltransferase [Bacillota bacterium]|nr:uroporphyrinogen-III C-methyltransferase [Bacillota bacterium]
MEKPIVYLVGAGPGDPGLITVKGLECIKKADVLVYDRLASSRLLAHARPDAELIFVGKSPDRHVLRQEEINQVLVDKAKENKIVTRLKGGDPFIFGRGGEEAEVLLEHGIKFEIVPGITSAISVPAYAGIPVTHRDFTASFAVITGNEDPNKEESNIHWDKIATGVGTLIFLMGMGNLPKIVAKLIEHGRAKDTPIALIRWGTRPEQQTLVGNLDNIVQKSTEAQFKNPAIIIVGEVVTLREKLQWFENKPLFGKRVLVTRSRSQASDFAKRIEELGGEPFEFPTIEIESPDYQGLDQSINKIEEYNWIIFTSVNGVQSFFNRLFKLGKDIRELQNASICAVGPKTKEALEEKGLIVDYIPGEYRAEAIIEGLQGKVMAGHKVLLPRADIARKVLPKALTEMGALVDDEVAYVTKRSDANGIILKQMLADKEVNVITFTSSSTVKNFVELLGVEKEELAQLLTGVFVASIGPITTATAEELGIKVDAQAEEYTIDGLINSILV